MEVGELAKTLDAASIELSNLGLVLSAKWASEASAGTGAQFDYEASQISRLSPSAVRAKTYFDSHEYDRCWHSLKNTDQNDAGARFLRLFARYHSGERRKEEDQGDEIFPVNARPALNPYLIDILDEINSLESALQENAFILFLKGIVMRHQHKPDEARELFIASVCKYPWNWGCWMELHRCLKKVDQTNEVFERVQAKTDIMAHMFRLYSYQEFLQTSGATIQEDIEILSKKFPQFAYVKIQQALIHIHDFDHDEACQIFEQVLKEDPFRLEGIDLYSNLLYVTEQRAKLSFLAQLVAKTDKFRPESCCVIANYYSLLGKHAQAVSYYQRALVINRNHLPAWTLMGHEYVELNNLPAAIESYRAALSINSSDFRAWYGLGGAYETMGVHAFAQYYYEQALALRSTDHRIWKAVGNILELQNELEPAIHAYLQALRLVNGDAYVCYRLGLLYSNVNNVDMATRHMSLSVDVLDADEDPEEAIEAAAKASIWLAKHHANTGSWSRAVEYAEAIINNPPSTQAGPTLVEAAREILRGAAAR